MRRDADRGRSTGRTTELVLGACVLACAVATVHGLTRLMATRMGLQPVLGTAWSFILAGTIVALLFEIAALLRCAGAIFGVGRTLPGISGGKLLRRLVCACLLFPLTFLLAWQPFERVHFDAALGLFGGVFALLVVLRGTSVVPGRVVRILDFTAFQVCALLVLGEVFLRTWAMIAPAPVLVLGEATDRQRLEAHRGWPGAQRFGFPFNSDGHYDEEFTPRPAGQQLVCTIGDSFSVGIVPHDRHFTTVAERVLELPIHNFGVSASGPAEYLYLLREEVLPHEPDLILVNLFIGNDLKAMPYDPPHRLIRSLFERENLAVMVVPRRLWMIWNNARKLQATAEVDSERFVPSQIEATADMPWLDDPTLERPTSHDGHYRELELKRARETCVEGSVNYERLGGILHEIVTTAAPTPVHFVLIPDEFQVNDRLWSEMIADDPETPFVRNLPQTRLATWCDEQVVGYLDLLPYLRAAEPLENGERHLYHRNDSHFNSRGNRIAGEALAAYVAEHLE